VISKQHRVLNLTKCVKVNSTPISGVTRGTGARGQGILTAPQEKSLKFFCSIGNKIDAYPSQFLMTFFSHRPILYRHSLQRTDFAPPVLN